MMPAMNHAVPCLGCAMNAQLILATITPKQYNITVVNIYESNTSDAINKLVMSVPIQALTTTAKSKFQLDPRAQAMTHPSADDRERPIKDLIVVSPKVSSMSVMSIAIIVQKIVWRSHVLNI